MDSVVLSIFVIKFYYIREYLVVFKKWSKVNQYKYLLIKKSSDCSINLRGIDCFHHRYW